MITMSRRNAIHSSSLLGEAFGGVDVSGISFTGVSGVGEEEGMTSDIMND